MSARLEMRYAGAHGDAAHAYAHGGSNIDTPTDYDCHTATDPDCCAECHPLVHACANCDPESFRCPHAKPDAEPQP